MNTPFLPLLRATLAISDLALLNLSFFVSFHLASKFGPSLNINLFYDNLLACNLIWLGLTFFFRLYSTSKTSTLESIYRGTWRSICLHALILISYVLVNGDLNVVASWLIAFYAMTISGFILSRFTATALEQVFRKEFPVSELPIGNTKGPTKMKLAAFYDHVPSKYKDFQETLSKEKLYVNASGDLSADSGIKKIFRLLSNAKHETSPQPPLKGTYKPEVKLQLIPDFSPGTGAFSLDHIGGFPVLSLKNEPLESLENKLKKRFMDIVISTVLLVVVLSWLYPIIAILIKMQSPGPVLIKQLKTGRNDKPFWAYKFRCTDLDDARGGKLPSVGKFLRLSGLNELPQLLNVVTGNMSIVGPCAKSPALRNKYRELMDQHFFRQSLKPGITGWAQANGLGDDISMRKRVVYDAWYMENWSAMLDIRILFLSVINAFKAR